MPFHASKRIYRTCLTVVTIGTLFFCPVLDIPHVKADVAFDQLYPIWNETYSVDGGNTQYGNKIASEGADIYFSGITNAPASAALLMKLNATGDLSWLKTWGGKMECSNSVALGKNASGTYIYLAGSQRGKVPPYACDFLLLKYDSNGTEIWNRSWGGAGWDDAYSIAVHNTAIYVVGNNAGSPALVKFDTDGTEIWNITLTFSSNDTLVAVACDDAGFIYTAGTSGQTGEPDSVLIKYDSYGNEIWNRTYGGLHTQEACSIAISGDSVYVFGETYYINGMGDHETVSYYLLSYDTHGNYYKNRTLDIKDYGYLVTIAADESSVYVTGHYFDNSTLRRSVVVLKCDPALDTIWLKLWKDDAHQYLSWSIIVDESYMYIAGDVSLDLPPQTLFLFKGDKDGGTPPVHELLMWQGFVLIAVLIVIIPFFTMKNRYCCVRELD